MKRVLLIFISVLAVASLTLMMSLSAFAANTTVSEFPFSVENVSSGGNDAYIYQFDTEKQYIVTQSGGRFGFDNQTLISATSSIREFSAKITYDIENSCWYITLLNDAYVRNGNTETLQSAGYSFTGTASIRSIVSYSLLSPVSITVSEYTEPSPIDSAMEIVTDISDVALSTGDKIIQFCMQNPVALLGIGAFLVILFVSFITRFFKT